MENVFIYDDTFYGLLILIQELLNKNITPHNIKGENYNRSLLERIIKLKIDNTNYDVKKLIQNIGNDNFQVIFYVFLSNKENKELVIYYYLKNALKYRNSLKYRRNLKCVDVALKIEHYVRSENHKFKGFTRFKELESQVYYAEINPENDILFLLSQHFQKRLGNEYWIIKDVKRKKYSIYNKKEFYIISENEFKLFDVKLSDKEKKFETLWKTFYDTIGIEARRNERCRMNFMPKKYWPYILEASDKI